MPGSSLSQASVCLLSPEALPMSVEFSNANVRDWSLIIKIIIDQADFE